MFLLFRYLLKPVYQQVQYLQQQGYKLDCIAVEYNGTIVTREQYVSVVLEPTDVLEIVSFVGGG